MSQSDEKEGHPFDRPLPSVDMRLLRSDRRQSFTRRSILVGALLILGVPGAIAWVWLAGESMDIPAAQPPATTASEAASGIVYDPVLGTWSAPPNSPPPTPDAEARRAPVPEPVEQEEPEAEEAPSAMPEPEPVIRVGNGRQQETTFGQARGFRDALRRIGLEREACAELESALEDHMDFRRCRPEDRIVFETARDGKLSLFEYHQNGVEYVQARRGRSGTLTARRVRRPTTTVRRGFTGVIRSSLGDALRTAGLSRRLVGEFIEAFDGRIDFSTDTREGDTFRILLDEERLDGRFVEYGTIHAVQYTGQRTETKRAFWYAPRNRRAEYYDEEGRAVYGSWLRTPCRYDRISSPFDPRRMHPILRRIVPHNGVDYAASTGTPVWAAAEGTVTFAGVRGANGNLVSIEHADGYSTHYAHLHRITPGITRGVEVQQRQRIGQVGSTGRSTGPHLHFGLKRRGRFVDPLPEINGPGRPMPAPDLRRYRAHMQGLVRALSAIPTR